MEDVVRRVESRSVVHGLRRNVRLDAEGHARPQRCGRDADGSKCPRETARAVCAWTAAAAAGRWRCGRSDGGGAVGSDLHRRAPSRP